MSDNLRIKFKGQEFILVGDMEEGGAIATQQAYEDFEPSYAHYFTTGPDAGKVMQWGEQIGTTEDIEVLGPSDVEPNDEGIAKAFDPFTPPWVKPS